MTGLQKRHVIFLAILLLVSVVVRLDFGLFYGVGLKPDSKAYLENANDILVYGQFVHPHRSFGYGLFLVFNYMVFGYQEFTAIVIVQSILSVISVLLLYYLVYRFTRSPTVAFIFGLIFAVDYHVCTYNPYIITECIAVFLVLVLFYLLLIAIEHGWRLPYAMLFHLCFISLLFVRAIFLPAIIISPLCALILYFRDKKIAPVINILATFLLIVIIPLGIYASNMRRAYGFWGFTNAAQRNIFGVVLEYDMHHNASKKYSDFLEVLESTRSSLEGCHEYDAFILSIHLKDHIPRRTDEDYRYFVQFSKSCILNAPFSYISKSLGKVDDVFVGRKKPPAFEHHENIYRKITKVFYKYTTFRFFTRILALIFMLLFSFYIPLMVYRKYFTLRMVAIFMILFTWILILTIAFLSYSSFDRLRTPADPLILIITAIGAYDIFLLVKKHIFRKEVELL